LLAFIIAMALIIPISPFIVGSILGRDVIPHAALGGGILAALTVVGGIVGLIRARGGRQRGRGFGIAAIPIGVIAIFTQVVIGAGIYAFVTVAEQSHAAVKILAIAQSDIPQKTDEWYDARTTKQFKANVTKEDFAAWVRSVLDKHGQLQNSELDRKAKAKREHEVITMRYTGRFVNGGAPIDVSMFFDDGSGPKVDNIRVGDKSARP
jgi:hypothetical protein